MTTTRIASGVFYAIGAAVLFGLSTPLTKLLLGDVHPLVLAGVLYAGSGIGLLAVLGLRSTTSGDAAAIAWPPRRELGWLAGAIFFGGIVGPVLLMFGLMNTGASTAALLLNLESVLTALLAWFLFRENFDRRIALGMTFIVAGGLALTWTPLTKTGGNAVSLSPSALLIAGACLAWAIDNNITRKVSASNAVAISSVKGLAAGAVNLTLAAALGIGFPASSYVLWGGLIGFFGYGVSLVLFVLALRGLGTARTGAYFSLAPFFGAAAAVGLGTDTFTLQLTAAATLMALGVWLHLTEHHEHDHVHDAATHTHAHEHDDHHQHDHAPGDDASEPHTHAHVHKPLKHRHRHFPDIHHRHSH